jgi:5'(3')-deoxyribonucleotidase
LHLAARLVGQENVCIATSPTKCPESLAGKLDWIHRVMPPWMHRQYAITPRKHLLARPDALLIDDVEANIERFEAGGGRGVLVPRPWNRLRGQDPFEAIERQMEKSF